MPPSGLIMACLVSWTPAGWSSQYCGQPGVQPKPSHIPSPSGLWAGSSSLLTVKTTPSSTQGHIDYIMSLCMFNDGSDSKHQLVSPAFSRRRIRGGGGWTRSLPPAMQNSASCPHVCQYLTCRLLIFLFPTDPWLHHVSTPEGSLTCSTPEEYSKRQPFF